MQDGVLAGVGLPSGEWNNCTQSICTLSCGTSFVTITWLADVKLHDDYQQAVDPRVAGCTYGL